MRVGGGVPGGPVVGRCYQHGGRSCQYGGEILGWGEVLIIGGGTCSVGGVLSGGLSVWGKRFSGRGRFSMQEHLP